MERNDRFNRTYPLAAAVLFVLITLSAVLLTLVLCSDYIIGTFSDTSRLSSLARTAQRALACAVLALLLGAPGARILSSGRFPLRGLFRWILAASLLVPYATSGLCIHRALAFFRISIPGFWLETVIVQVITDIPLVILILGEYRLTLSQNLYSSSRSLGPGSLFLPVTLPLMRPAILGVLGLCFMRAMVSGVSSDISYVTSLIALLILPFFCVYAKKPGALLLSKSDPGFKAKGGLPAVLGTIYVIVLSALLIAPAAFCVYGFATKAGAGGITTILLGIGDIEADWQVLALALASAVLCTLIATPLSHAVRHLNVPLFPLLIALPLAGLLFDGYLILGDLIPAIPFAVLQMLCNTAVLIPVSLIILIPAFRFVPEHLGEVSVTLGFSQGKSYMRIDRKILARSTASACLITYSLCLMHGGNASVLCLLAFTIGFCLIRKGVNNG